MVPFNQYQIPSPNTESIQTEETFCLAHRVFNFYAKQFTMQQHYTLSILSIPSPENSLNAEMYDAEASH